MNKAIVTVFMASAAGASSGETPQWLVDNLPLFLAVMFLLPLVITGAVLYKVFYAGRKDLLKRRARATEAVATVVHLEQAVGQARIGGKTYIKVRLRLKVADTYKGDYEVEAVWWINFLFTPQVQEGSAISVKVETTPGGQIFPNTPWAGITMADLFLSR